MKNSFIVFLLLFIGHNSFGQVKSVMFDRKDQLTLDSAQAATYAVFGKVEGDSLYTFKKFDFEGILLASGTFKDDSLQVPHGKFTYYNWITPENNPVNMDFEINGRERYIESTGTFTNGLKTGRWITFYPNRAMKEIATYSQGVLHGAYQSFSIHGKIIISGLFVAGKKNGTWTLNGGKQENEYVNDQLISTLKGKKLRDKQVKGNNIN
ncbi:toxin-antitoxin system YwqK family antitoxin [Pedobacter sp. AW31-3R]|uniref:toxin-antitoxin system YwqK family antitoxin n=1 Tax=Pedobacter sp. AW31-3R TaxID=3445781 RepID=UPI003FA0629F